MTMSRLWAVLLIVLLLAGCASGEMPETSDPSTAPTETEATDPGLYIPDSFVEQQTGGAVQVYDLDGKDYSWITPLNDRILLASWDEQTELTLLTGERGRVTASVAIGSDLTLDSSSWQITATGFAFYSEAENAVIYMDSGLSRIGSVSLPKGVNGKALIDPKSDNIYYCLADEIHVLDPDTRISRLIRKHSCADLQLTGIYFNGTVLSCRSTNLNGEERVVYLSSQTGETLSTDRNITALTTWENRYFAVRSDGIVKQQIFGTLDGPAQNLNTSGDLIAALPANGVVKYTLMEGGLELCFYDFASGQQTAGVTLPGVTEVTSLSVKGNYLLILAYEGITQRIYKWDILKSSVTDETVWVGPLYTDTAPDGVGLQECQKRVDALNKTHGLSIRIWQDAVKDTGGYVLELEYQTEAINKMLDELEPVLALFPENFLYKSVNTRVRICIVRSISDGITCAHYWRNDDFYIILSAGANVFEELLRATGYVISTNVMGNSPILDSWASLNPEGFTYGVPEGFMQYLEGETKAFADADSMQSITEDRSRLFWYAVKVDNAQMFQPPAMQAKLVLLCKGIRDAWRLERKTEVYPWEQYLHESIAYIKR